MIKVIMHGCNGKMGQVITGLVQEEEGMEIVAGIDVWDGITNPYPVFTNIHDCNVAADVIIDFASAKAVDSLLDYSVDRNIPVVLCTTGMSEAQLDYIKECSEKVAILKSANMSVGINTLMKVLQSISGVLKDAGFDIEIIEKHHRLKVDAPSGTALALADAINESVGNTYTYQYDRSKIREPRADNEIGIQALRGGTIVGEHDIVFAGTDEVIQMSHTAYSKAIFGKGAIQAAKFLKGKPAGYYGMEDVIS
ncbi:MAG TPA: 4-hydroxy-tetrahydrodipicolinate reductase [Candidatus Dorea intestinavium]|nr:4-hydroxy-tetrahydrodipicolinate reductase [Candidatus Dorea intestinavium]